MDPLFRRDRLGSSGGPMILGIESPVTTLTKWLEIATYDLIAPAKERIRSEIEAHYAEAVANHLARGVSQAEAEMAALAELGSAPAAAKKFSKQFLSESAVSRFESGVKALGRWPFLLYCYCIFFIFFLLLLYKKENIPIFIFQFIGSVVLPTVIFRIARRQSGKPNAFWVCWLNILRPVAFMGIYFNLLLLDSKHPEEPNFRICVGFASLWFFILCSHCMAWKQQYMKLKQIWPEEPPQGTALS
jgi:hypothetical protein